MGKDFKFGVRMLRKSPAFTVMAVLALGLGLIGALGATRVLQSLLFDVTPTDPATFLAVAAILTAVAFLASYGPARRAAKVDPIEALRHE
jgi:putative ABC transport system permease protein